jgi:hypothetical protein
MTGAGSFYQQLLNVIKMSILSLCCSQVEVAAHVAAGMTATSSCCQRMCGPLMK